MLYKSKILTLVTMVYSCYVYEYCLKTNHPDHQGSVWKHVQKQSLMIDFDNSSIMFYITKICFDSWNDLNLMFSNIFFKIT